MKKISLVLLLIVLFAGCASNSSKAKIDMYNPNSGDELKRNQTASEIADKIKQANTFMKNKDWRSASILYQQLLTENKSVDGALECACRTNLALCNIEDGNRLSFKINADKLLQDCKQQTYLSRETQFVLSVNDQLDDKKGQQTDARIESRIYNSIKELLKGGE